MDGTVNLADLVSSARRIPPVPEEAADAYAAAGEVLIGAVFHGLRVGTDRELLWPGATDRAVAADLRFHHELLAMVLRLRAFGVLARTLPWLLRTSRARGARPDYHRVVQNAFARATQEILPPRHATAILPVYAWIDAHHEAVVAASTLPDVGPSLDPARDAVRRRFLDALLRGDVAAGHALMAEQTGTGEGLSRFYLDVLDPAMEEVGRRWETDELSVADEHVATGVAARVMASTFSSLPRRPAIKGRVIVTTAPGELHELGARILADLFERAGWEVLFLGANTPVGETVRFARRQRPTFVAVSVALPVHVTGAVDLVNALRDDPVLADVRVMVGGQAFRRHPELVAVVGADGYASDAVGAVRLADGWAARDAAVEGVA